MDLGWHLVAFLVTAALVAGWVDAVVGGGGLIQLPSLLIGLPADTPVATVSGTNKISSAAGTLVATGTYLRKVKVQWLYALPLMLAAYVGSSIGARLVTLMPREWFTPIVLVALIGVGWYTVRRPQMGLNHEVRRSGWPLALMMTAIGLVIGIYDGFLGPGTGSFFVIALVAILGYGFLQASAMAKLANLTTNVAAIVVLHDVINWKIGLAMATANLTGGFVGAAMAVRWGNAFVRRVFLVVVVVLGLRLAWDTVRMVL
ncbi:TSUP family transporter [Aestuariimicrobium sp. p3-SID1156]|uniref:sulfite exporter TauE/SafE family protein n=1 Tax=Aestuariimicrobium sp. p3-SID1156 TaxID=2916038 RepID=UPI0021E49752|nr:TSUP family transporter [Aestuariimicrobium sp. p3-SID1156]MCT1459676.1 TSUP family transporter [Aestuariimicrobium sp. p3-SID1156]